MDLRGKRVVIFCVNYIYDGILDEVLFDKIAISEPRIVYETGPFTAKEWQTAERLPVEILWIERSAIESMGELSRDR